MTCNCNNQVVVAALASRSSRNTEMMHLLRCLFIIEASLQFSFHSIGQHNWEELLDRNGGEENLASHCSWNQRRSQ